MSPSTRGLLAALLLCASCGAEPKDVSATGPAGLSLPAAICPSASDPARACNYPRLNRVFQKAGHNSYWVQWGTPGGLDDIGAAGVRVTLADQLLHDHVRTVELDLHYDAGHPGEFSVYHTGNPPGLPYRDTQVIRLQDALRALRQLDRLVPAHEVVTLILEFKEHSANVFASRQVFGADHHPADLDRTLREELGDSLYTPAEYMSDPACAGKLTLRQCLQARQLSGRPWPSINELRGRYLVAVHGTYRYVKADVFQDDLSLNTYLTSPGPLSRTGFPLVAVEDNFLSYATVNAGAAASPNSVNNGNGGGLAPYGELTWSQLKNLYDNAILAQGETIGDAFLTSLLADGGLVRSVSSVLAFNPTSPCPLLNCGYSAPDDIGTDQQSDTISTLGYQLVMSDFPENFIQDAFENAAGSGARSATHRPFFFKEETPPLRAPGPGDLAVPAGHDRADVTEPGARLYFDGSRRLTSTAPALDLGPWTRYPTTPVGDLPQSPAQILEAYRAQDTRSRWVLAYKFLPAGSATDTWSFAHSAPNGGHDYGPFSIAQGGDGCLAAYNATASHFLKVCHHMEDSQGKQTAMYVTWANGGAAQVYRETHSSYDYAAPTSDPAQGAIGDNEFWVQLVRSGSTTNATVRRYRKDGMGWVPVPFNGGSGTLTIGANLNQQGLEQYDSGVFIATRYNGSYVRASGFSSVTGAVYDQSFCLNDSCRGGQTVPRSATVTPGGQSGSLLMVYHASTTLYEAMSHVYTTNIYEASEVGNPSILFGVEQALPSSGSWTALTRCVVSTADRHEEWISTDSGGGSCKAYTAPTASWLLGYAARAALPGTLPLYHLRNPSTREHAFTTDAQAFAVWRTGGFYPICESGSGYIDCRANPQPMAWVYPAWGFTGANLAFGGMYGYGASSSYVNPATGALSCPAGYTDAKVLGTAGVDYDVHLCTRLLPPGEAPLYDFGGMYGVGKEVKAGVVFNYINPATNANTCPAGYAAAQVLGSPSVDNLVAYCYRLHTAQASGPFTFGGVWGTGASGSYPNPATGAGSCPSNFSWSVHLGTPGTDYSLYLCYQPLTYAIPRVGIDRAISAYYAGLHYLNSAWYPSAYYPEAWDAFYLYPSGLSPLAGMAAFYQCVSSDGHTYFYTTSSSCEGAAGYAKQESLGSLSLTQVSGTVPLHRYRSSLIADHYYYPGAGAPPAIGGYVYEGIAGYVFTSP